MNCAMILPVGSAAVLGDVPVRAWCQEFLGYFDTHRSSNGGTEAINGLIGLHRASVTLTTTASECSSSPADSTPNDEEPVKPLI